MISNLGRLSISIFQSAITRRSPGRRRHYAGGSGALAGGSGALAWCTGMVMLFFIIIKLPIKIPIADILLDEKIYPRKSIDQKRVAIFAENIRDGFQFDPIEVEPHPDK